MAKDKELTWDKTSYVITCGAEDRNGQRKPKVWRLGDDLRIANAKRVFIRMVWAEQKEASKAAGIQPVWTKRYLDQVQQNMAFVLGKVDEAAHVQNWLNNYGTDARQQLPSSTAGSNADASDKAAPSYSLLDAISDYTTKLEGDVLAGERGQADATRQQTSLKQFIRFISDKPYDPETDKRLPKNPTDQRSYFDTLFSQTSPVCTRPLEQIGHDQLSAFKTNIQNRRVSGYHPYTIRDACQHVENLLVWLEDTRRWNANCNYGRLLKVKTARLFTPAEQKAKAKGQKTYTFDELACLYAYGNDQQRLYVMLGCNLVAAQQTLADLLLEDLHLDDAQPHVEFIRGKTRASANGGSGIETRYDLWPLTAELLKKRVAITPDNEAGLALLTSDGHPLVRHNAGPKKKSKTDSVNLTFKKLLKACNAPDQKVRPLGFKYIRKTISTAIRNATDEFTQQQALAQSSKTVAGQHYTGQQTFGKMNDALKAVWAELEPKFLAAAQKVEAERLTARGARRAAYVERQKVTKAARYAKKMALATV